MKISISLKVSIEEKSVGKALTNRGMDDLSLVKCVEEERERATLRRGYSTAANYVTALHSLLRYLEAGDISLRCITADMLLGWQRWMLGNGISLNTISCYMRSMRSVVNRAHDGRTPLFKKVFTGRTRTVKRSVKSCDISRLLALPLCEGTHDFMVRDIFLFSFYCQGMPFVDVAFLRKEQLRDGYIQYTRHKTGQTVRIAENPSISGILSRYMRDDAPYVFPIIQTPDPKEAFRQYRIQLSGYNKALHRLGKMADIDTRLTSYVARHSWASIAFHNNVDLPVISQAMGHTDTTATMIYIRELDSARMDEANRVVIASLHKDEPCRQ